jgi:hypothetical protein
LEDGQGSGSSGSTRSINSSGGYTAPGSSAGTPITLSWNVSGASYAIVSPDFGAVRGTSATVSPTQSTTYTIYANNAFGRSTPTINITVH